MATTKENAATAAMAVPTAEKVIVTINEVRLFNNDGKSNACIIFNEPIKGFDESSGIRTLTDVKKVSLSAKYLRKMMYKEDENLPLYKVINKGLDETALNKLLFNAKIVLLRHFHVAGEEAPESESGCYTQDCYSTEIERIAFRGGVKEQIAAKVAL